MRQGILILVAVILLGCQAAISREIREQVDESVTFEQVLSDPEQFKGKTILWGGEILETRNAQEAAFLEVLQRPLGPEDRPIRDAMSKGRFLVSHKGFLDPAIYRQGYDITIVGEVVGTRVKVIDEIEYTYPLVEDLELVLWEHRRRRPVFHFGVGATLVR